MDQRERIKLVASIFNEHGPRIRLMIRRYVRDENDVDDMYQNIFLSLVRTPPSDLTFLLAYLGRVVRNHATDVARRTASYAGCVERYTQLQPNAPSGSSPEARLVQREYAEETSLLLTSILPPHMAAVLVERYMHNRNMAETAEQLGLKERTVSRYCCIALKRIRRLIDEGKVATTAFG